MKRSIFSLFRRKDKQFDSISQIELERPNYANLGSPSILFVCYANICRSPTAEAVFRGKARQAGLTCFIDSAGTHASSKQRHRPDNRAMSAAEELGYDFTGILSRPVNAEDLASFDLIVPMDKSNYESLLARTPEDRHERIRPMMSFADTSINQKIDEVPDPYYGGANGFRVVLDLIERSCDGLIAHLQSSPQIQENN